MRPADWPERLEAHLDAWAARPFFWGGNDCLQFVSAWAEALTGDGPAGRWVGAYEGPISAHRIMRAHGCRDLHAFVDFLFGPRLASPAFATRGDVVSAQGCLGVSLGDRGAFMAPGAGLVALPARAFTDAWRV